MFGWNVLQNINEHFDRLVEVLGKPTFTSADPYDKVNWWVINAQYYGANNVDEIDYDDWEYETVTIYNWKDGRFL